MDRYTWVRAYIDAFASSPVARSRSASRIISFRWNSRSDSKSYMNPFLLEDEDLRLAFRSGGRVALLAIQERENEPMIPPGPTRASRRPSRSIRTLPRTITMS